MLTGVITEADGVDDNRTACSQTGDAGDAGCRVNVDSEEGQRSDR